MTATPLVIPEGMTEQEVRAQAADWLTESLQIMNDNGSHWTQHAYVDKVGRFGEEEPLTVYCAAGGIRKVRSDRILGEFPEVPRDDEADDGGDMTRSFEYISDPQYWGRNDQVSDEDAEEMKRASERYDAIFQASECALAWAMWAVSIQEKDTEHTAAVLTTVMVGENETTARYAPAKLSDAESAIVNFNDNSYTEWNHIVKTHQFAIQSLRDGKAPIDWSQAGADLLDESKLLLMGEEAQATTDQ